MKTYFICSDIHGFYNEWMSSLNQSGFDIKNENHILIILGDIFDRGPDPWKFYKFIKSLEPNRAILVKGNHEYLLLELINRKIPFDYDYHNGTYQTLISLYKDPVQSRKQWLKKNVSKYKDDWDLYDASFKYFVSQEKKLYNNKKINEIVEWLKSSSWRNYFELGKYIFVHSFIPLKKEDSGDKYFYYADWRSETNQRSWELSTWGCPYDLYLKGYFNEEVKNGKILVCGHWHTSDFYNNLLYKNEPNKQLDVRTDNPIFKSDLYPGLIGLDTCTTLTKKVNILVLKEEEM